MKKAFKSGKIDVFDSTVFLDCEKALIISAKNGTTLFMTMDCAEEFIREQITDDLGFVLVQRGMASYGASRPVSNAGDQIFPTFFLIDLTKQCSLRCVYCFRELNDDAPVMERKMLSAICDELIDYCEENNSDHITIQPWGGEPLLEFDSLIYIRERFSKAGMHPKIVVETNATLITPEKAKLLYKNDIEVGVSIDGCSEVHDAQRSFENGIPSLEIIERGIANLRSAGYKKIFSITVVTQNTLKHLEKIIRYFAFDLKLNGIKLNLMRRTDRNRKLALEPDQIDEYVEKLISCLRNCYGHGVEITEQNIAQRLRNLTCRPCDNICNAHGCHGGFRMLSIDANGGIYPCELSDYSSYCLGNVGDKGFVEMVNEAIKDGHEYFRPRESDDCADCPWFFYCRGGCRAAVKYDCGNPRNIDKTECLFNKALYPQLVRILLNEPEFASYLMNGRISI